MLSPPSRSERRSFHSTKGIYVRKGRVVIQQMRIDVAFSSRCTSRRHSGVVARHPSGGGTSLLEGIFPLNEPIRAHLFLLAPRPKSRRHHINNCKGWAWFEARISKALVQVFWTCCWNDNKSILIIFIKRKRSKPRNKCCQGSGAKSSNSGTGPRTIIPAWVSLTCSYLQTRRVSDRNEAPIRRNWRHETSHSCVTDWLLFLQPLSMEKFCKLPLPRWRIRKNGRQNGHFGRPPDWDGRRKRPFCAIFCMCPPPPPTTLIPHIEVRFKWMWRDGAKNFAKTI